MSRRKREERQVAAGIDETWSMDFMSDVLFDGPRRRLLTIVDNFTCESLAIKGKELSDSLLHQGLDSQEQVARGPLSRPTLGII